MFTLAQPAYHRYNPYEELVMQQELQRRRLVEAYLRRQREAEEIERRRREYEAAVRAEYERRQQAELERRRQAELQRRQQAHQARGRHSMYDGGLESMFDALYGGQSSRQARPWNHTHEERQPNPTARESPTPTPSRDSASTPVPVSTPAPVPTNTDPELEKEPQVDTAPSHAAIQSILSSLTALQSGFAFPTQLDFQPGSSKPAYTPNNAPLHGYEHALTGLLTRLDAVESYGDDGVRRARKEAVKTIEQELERLDGMKAEAWKRTNEPEPEVIKSNTGSEVDPTSVPLPEDEDEEMKNASQTTVSRSPTAESEEPSAPTDYEPTQPTVLSEPDHSTSSEQSLDVDPTSSSTSTIDTEPAVSDDVLSIPDPLARSLTSPSPSNATGSDSGSGLELEECVDVGTMPVSEDESADLEKVENEGDLELMHDWDLDF